MRIDENDSSVIPEHPGPILKRWFMDNNNMSVNDLSISTTIPVEKIEMIISGSAEIDRPIALLLTRAFGDSAETLYRIQDSYNFYLKSSKIKAFEELPLLHHKPESA